MRYGHNKLTNRTHTLLLHPWLLTADVFLCKAVSEVLFADTYMILSWWRLYWGVKQWNIGYTVHKSSQNTQKYSLVCLLKEWYTIKYILLSVITNVCSDLIFITENPVSLFSVEPKFTSSHIIFRNMTDETQVSFTLMKVKLLKNVYQQRDSSFLGQCSAMISNQ